MAFLQSFVALIALSVSVNAAIGPVTDLHIVNANISPDGFSRPTVLAGGTFPGPVIQGNKVGHPAKYSLNSTILISDIIGRQLPDHCVQRPHGSQHVDRYLYCMVPAPSRLRSDLTLSFSSTGTVSSRRALTGLMVRHSSLNAPSSLGTLSTTTSTFRTKQVSAAQRLDAEIRSLTL